MNVVLSSRNIAIWWTAYCVLENVLLENVSVALILESFHIKIKENYKMELPQVSNYIQ